MGIPYSASASCKPSPHSSDYSGIHYVSLLRAQWVSQATLSEIHSRCRSICFCAICLCVLYNVLIFSYIISQLQSVNNLCSLRLVAKTAVDLIQLTQK